MRQTLQARTSVAVPAATVFECLADYRCADVFIEGLEKLTPLGSQTTGEGAQFEATLKVGVRTLRTRIVIESLEPYSSVTWSSAGDEGQTLMFELQEGPHGTEVSLTVVYEPPGGLAGALIAPFVDRTVRHRATGTLDRLREHLSPA